VSLGTRTPVGHSARETGLMVASPAGTALFSMMAWLRGVDLNHRPLGSQPKEASSRLPF
jgi:hypothetical protein